MFGILRKKLKESIDKLSKKLRADEVLEIGEPKEIKKSVSAKRPEEKQKKAKEKEIETPEKSKSRPETSKKDFERKEAESAEFFEDAVEEEEKEVLGKRHEKEELKEISAERKKKTSEEKPEEAREIKKEEEKGGFRIFKKLTERKLTESDIDGFFVDVEFGLLEANVALEVIDFLKAELKKSLVGKDVKRLKSESEVKEAFKEALIKVVDHGSVDLESSINKAKQNKRPATFLFIGFNGSGKTTSIAKVANYLKAAGHRPVLAAGDTFRAAAIHQLEEHANRIGVKIVKHDYGADPAAVIFDAVKHAEAKGFDAVLADTAGRTHSNTNLLDELKKVVRVNKPDLKILVVDSLTGNDAVEQARQFDSEIGVDAVILTKIDVNEKGGAILSVAYAIKKPILFLGTGQKYGEFVKFEPQKFVDGLLE